MVVIRKMVAKILKEDSLKNILVIDDELAMRKGIKLMLQREGYGVFEAKGGEEGLQILAGQRIELVILDLFLPGRDGLDLAADLLRQNSDLKILLLTAHGGHPRAQQAKQLFKENYLEKVSLDSVLPKKVQELLTT